MPTDTAQEPQGDAFDQAWQQAAQEQSTETPEPEVPEGDTKESEQPPAEQKKADDQPKETAKDELLSDEEYDKLKDNPKALRKALNKSYTTKTQKLAEEQKALVAQQEEVAAFKDLISDLKERPQDTIKLLATQYGLTVSEAKAAVKAVEAEAAKTDPRASRIEAKLMNLLGTDNAELAKGLASVFSEELADLKKTEVEPLRARQEQDLEQRIVEESQSDLKAARERHKDWDQYSAKILDLGRKLQPVPGSGMTTAEYLDLLYDRVKPSTSAEQTLKVVERINNSARNAEPPDTGVNANIVKAAPPKLPTLEEAWEGAKRGERWE